jgi:hypothetical protein
VGLTPERFAEQVAEQAALGQPDTR